MTWLKKSKMELDRKAREEVSEAEKEVYKRTSVSSTRLSGR